MAILRFIAPEMASAILKEGLANMRIAADSEVLFSSPMDDTPLPVHVVGLDSASVGDVTVPPSIWRYFFTADGTQMLADLDVDIDGELSFNSVSEGEGAQLYADAFAAVEAFAASADDHFSIRLLEVPALHEIALWLHGQKEDWMIEVLKRGELSDLKPVRLVEYVTDLSEAASNTYVLGARTEHDNADGNDFG